MPVYHRALAARLPERPVVVLNIGGVANVTWIGGDGALIAFDTGPGNALHRRLDGAPHRRARRRRRPALPPLAASMRDGAHRAAHARTISAGLRRSRSIATPSPLEPLAGLSLEDGAATLTAFTAASIARAREHFPEQPKLWVVSGGGRRNQTLMAMIAERVEAAVAPAEAAGMDGDAMEAEAWAYLAVRSLKGLPITFPGTTGAPRPLTGGVRAAAKG